MNLIKLFETQKILDERIVKEKGLEGQDLLPEKILALQVELGELANEWRGFKFWSEDRKPRTKREIECSHCAGHGDFEIQPEYSNHDVSYRDCEKFKGTGYSRVINPLLEEYVDCVHFFISLAIELQINPDDFIVTCDYTEPTTTATFNRVLSTLSSIEVLKDPNTPASFTVGDLQDTLHEAFSCFIGLGERYLNFTWEQIEQAYYAKNQINHERQATGY